MGAASALLYAARYPNSDLCGLILDSPFCSFRRLARDLVVEGQVSNGIRGPQQCAECFFVMPSGHNHTRSGQPASFVELTRTYPSWVSWLCRPWVTNTPG